MKVGECITEDGARVITGGSGDCEFPPLEEAFVVTAKPDESNPKIVWIEVEPMSEDNTSGFVSYKVGDEFKAQVRAIVDFINENIGKPLLEVLKMKLP